LPALEFAITCKLVSMLRSKSVSSFEIIGKRCRGRQNTWYQAFQIVYSTQETVKTECTPTVLAKDRSYKSQRPILGLLQPISIA
jgi:hypothetical protein